MGKGNFCFYFKESKAQSMNPKIHHILELFSDRYQLLALELILLLLIIIILNHQEMGKLYCFYSILKGTVACNAF